MNSDEANNFIHNKRSKWIKDKNPLPNHKDANMGSYAIEQRTEIHLYAVDKGDQEI